MTITMNPICACPRDATDAYWTKANDQEEVVGEAVLDPRLTQSQHSPTLWFSSPFAAVVVVVAHHERPSFVRWYRYCQPS
jgi:hypothetical protein